MSKPWYARRSPDEIVVFPWLHPRAVDYLEALLTPDMRVLEHGGGGSTLWFAGQVKEVVTIEHDPKWIAHLREIIPPNVHLITQTDMAVLLDTPFDLLFIDGEREERRIFIQAATALVKPGGWVVLDNANRPEYAEERAAFGKRAKMKARFDNNTPFSRYFITEFWRCESD